MLPVYFRQSILNAIARVKDLALQGRDQPGAAQEFAEKGYDELVSIQQDLYKPSPATSFIVPATQPEVTVTSAGVITPSATIPLPIPRPGWIIGIMISAAGNDDYTDHCMLQLSTDAGNYFLTTSTGADYIPCTVIKQASLALGMLPFARYVRPNDQWAVSFTSRDNAATWPSSGNIVYRPQIVFPFAADDDVRRDDFSRRQ